MLKNSEIDARVRLVIAAYFQGNKVRPADEPVIKAAMELSINLLQNINTLAIQARIANKGKPDAA